MKVECWLLTVDGDYSTESFAFATEDEIDAHLRLEGDTRDLGEIAEEASAKWDLITLDVPLNIEIIHGRDPDMSCEHTVFVNGERDDHWTVESVDPGAGHERSSWDEHTDWVESHQGYSPAFRQAVVAERAEASNSQYITD